MKTYEEKFVGKQKYLGDFPVAGYASKIMLGEKILEGWCGMYSFSEEYIGEKKIVGTKLYAVARSDVTHFDREQRYITDVMPRLMIYNKVKD